MHVKGGDNKWIEFVQEYPGDDRISLPESDQEFDKLEGVCYICKRFIYNLGFGETTPEGKKVYCFKHSPEHLHIIGETGIHQIRTEDLVMAEKKGKGTYNRRPQVKIGDTTAAQLAEITDRNPGVNEQTIVEALINMAHSKGWKFNFNVDMGQ